jgi:hypothetical protein
VVVPEGPAARLDPARRRPRQRLGLPLLSASSAFRTRIACLASSLALARLASRRGPTLSAAVAPRSHPQIPRPAEPAAWLADTVSYLRLYFGHVLIARLLLPGVCSLCVVAGSDSARGAAWPVRARCVRHAASAPAPAPLPRRGRRAPAFPATMSASSIAPELLARIAAALHTLGASVAVGESSSGGLVSAALLGIDGASAWYKGGAVLYTRSASAWAACPVRCSLQSPAERAASRGTCGRRRTCGRTGASCAVTHPCVRSSCTQRPDRGRRLGPREPRRRAAGRRVRRGRERHRRAQRHRAALPCVSVAGQIGRVPR